MSSKNISQARITNILKMQASGDRVVAFARQHGLEKKTYYRWKLISCTSEASDIEHFLEEENRHLRELIGELVQENRALTWIIEKRRCN